MKNTVIIILLALFAIVGTCYTIVRTKEQKNQALELQARKAEAERGKASARQKEAEALKAAEASKARAADKKAAAAKDERIAAEKKAEEAKADAQAVLAQKVKAEADAKAAADNARKAEADAKAAADRKAEAEALAAAAIATNEARQAELHLAETARLAVEADIRRREAENHAEELKKLELDKRLAETAELQETLRQREEATRPERTIKDLLSETERRRAEEEAAAAAEEEKRLAELAEKDRAAYEAEMERRRKINRYGVAGPDAKPLTPAEKILKGAEDALAQAGEEGRAAVHRRIVARLEPQIRLALRERRTGDAEFLMKSLQQLVPDYRADPKMLMDGSDRGEKPHE